MKCPECQSDHINKNGHRGQKQNYIGLAESPHPTPPMSGGLGGHTLPPRKTFSADPIYV